MAVAIVTLRWDGLSWIADDRVMVNASPSQGTVT
jgi:hypothetical protein